MEGIHQKSSAKTSGNEFSSVNESEGSSMKPPAFQLKVDGDNPGTPDEGNINKGEMSPPPFQLKANEGAGGKGNLPTDLRSGIESLSGVDMSDTQVEYNSSEPDKVGALAYAQGSSIKIAAGQEKHLPHEAWHVAQQKQGKVRANSEVNGKPINDEKNLENEADQMGAKSLAVGGQAKSAAPLQAKKQAAGAAIQRIPRSPGATPFEGKIIPWSTPLHEAENGSSRRLIDVPRNHPVQVLGGDAWLHCTTNLNGQAYDGYISHEQIKREVSVTNTTDTGNAYTSQLAMMNQTFAITKEVNFVDAGGFGRGGYSRLRARTISAISSYLNRKFKVRIASPDGSTQPGNGDYPITVAVTHNDSAGYSLQMHGGAHGRSGVSTAGGNIYELGQATETSVPDITLAHEGSHMVLGASDEYANASIPGRVLTNDHSLMANFYTQGVADAEIKARHFGFLVTEVGAMFPGRTISIVE